MNERRTTGIANVVADVVAAPERRRRRPAVGTRERTDGCSTAIATTCALTSAAIGGVCGLLLWFGGGLSRRRGGVGRLCGIHVGSSVDCVVVRGTTGAR